MSISKTTEQRKRYILSEMEPTWDTLALYPVHYLEIIETKNLSDSLRRFFIGETEGMIQIASDPFATGC